MEHQREDLGEDELEPIHIHTQRKHLRKHLRKACWLIDQVRIVVDQSPDELDPEGYFAKNLADVQCHLVASCLRFFKSKPEQF